MLFPESGEQGRDEGRGLGTGFWPQGTRPEAKGRAQGPTTPGLQPGFWAQGPGPKAWAPGLDPGPEACGPERMGRMAWARHDWFHLPGGWHVLLRIVRMSLSAEEVQKKYGELLSTAPYSACGSPYHLHKALIKAQAEDCGTASPPAAGWYAFQRK